MSLTVKDLFNLEALKGIELMTEGIGLKNEITWINIMEILDEISYLQRGELLLTTGYRLEDKELNKNLISMLCFKGLAGMGIQTGYYLDEIPEYIVEEGNKYKFPIFKIPMDLSFSIITQAVLKNAYNINVKFDKHLNKNILANLKAGEGISKENAIHISRNLHLDSNSNACLLILSIVDIYDMVISESLILNIVNKFRNYFHAHKMNTIIEILGDEVIFLISSSGKISTCDLSMYLTSVLKYAYKDNQNLVITMGGSKVFKRIDNLITSYKEAASSLSALEKIKVRRGICFYNYLPLFRTFGAINSDKYAVSFLEEKLEKLIEYDKEHNTNYFDTLKAFINNKCNANAASEKIYIHRHTLKNRLEKIGEIFDIDFDDYYEILGLSMAIYLHELFS